MRFLHSLVEYDVNYNGYQHLWRAASEAKIKKRFVANPVHLRAPNFCALIHTWIGSPPNKTFVI